MKFLISIFNKIIALIGAIEWKSNSKISDTDKALIREMLKKDYFVIMTRRSNHLSTYFISAADFLLRGKFAFWTHSLMNLEDSVETDADFRLLEATGTGVHYSEFDDVFDSQSVALLKPKNMTLDDWTSVLDTARAQLGKPYDTLFNIADESKLSCIELVRMVLMAEDNYQTNFANFEALIAKEKNVTPQMLYDCGDFVIHFEVRNK